MQIEIGDKVQTHLGVTCEITWVHGDMDVETTSKIVLGDNPDKVARFISLMHRVPDRLYVTSFDKRKDDHDVNWFTDRDYLEFFCGIDLDDPNNEFFADVRHAMDDPDFISVYEFGDTRFDVDTRQGRIDALKFYSENIGIGDDWPADSTDPGHYMARLDDWKLYYYDENGVKYHVRIVE